MAFNKADHIIKFKGRDYLPVPARVLWLRDEHPDWSITTKIIKVSLESRYALFEASIADETGRVLAMAHKFEGAFGDFCGKAETGAIGRALGFLGYGTDASDDEEEANNRPVDSPQQVQGNQPRREPQGQPARQQEARKPQEPISPEKISPEKDLRIRTVNLFAALGKDVRPGWVTWLQETYDCSNPAKADDAHMQAIHDALADAFKSVEPAEETANP